MVPGGRSASVGVGGYPLGGGNSFFAARVGLNCDSVRTYEVVLATGEILEVSRDSYPGLFRALRGVSNNFGIVTRFDTAVFSQQADIWAGVVVYEPSVITEYVSAATQRTENIARDPYAAWVAIVHYNSTTDQTLVFTILVHTQPVVDRRPVIFEDFYHLPNVMDTIRPSTILNFTTANNLPLGYRYGQGLEQ
ncbi:hypothetical protein FE257_000047 [Aspergillus nanangensis]|uniref:FAD-binding PCMH-type domain-containing protein n=1 Tax=Aspergillus nanangensis TaxID=2582783 RepID=A0AAD4CYM6_ASPNN|nr:hypothetical protein FE257_000047 [Aspergillus nanangensis]